MYIDAVSNGNSVAARQIENTLLGLDLVNKKGNQYYTYDTFAKWLEEN